MTISEIKNFLEKKLSEYKLNTIIEYQNKNYVFLDSKNGLEFDIPVFEFGNSEKDIKAIDRTSDVVFNAINKGKVLYSSDDFDPDEEEDYE